MDRPDQSNRTSLVMVGTTVGFVLGLFAAVAIAIWMFREDRPQLEREALDGAMARWKAAGLKDYELEVKLHGRRSDAVRIGVSGGVPVFLSINSNPVEGERARAAWTVEGQFEAISIDWKNAVESANPGQTILTAEFDPDLGYPLYYQKVALGRNEEIGWKLLKFTRLDAAP